MTETDSPLEWAREPMMGPLDTLMWRGEADRRLRNPICAVELCWTVCRTGTGWWPRTMGQPGWCRGSGSAFRTPRSVSARPVGLSIPISTCTTICAACGFPVTVPWANCSAASSKSP